MNFRLINVGMADLAVASAPDILRTVLGSCVGICLYDSVNRIGGLSHIMLPSISGSCSENHKKYADTAINVLISEMEKIGADRKKLTAKISGGSSMFKMCTVNMMSEIGRNNVLKVKEILDSLNIKIIAEDTGGDYGRTIDFHTGDGSLKIRSLGRQENIL
jgi:chemotaxis protein CheD